MNSQFRGRREKGARIAFMHYIVRHSNIADRLRSNFSEAIPSAIKIIENGPKVIAAIKDIPEDTVLGKIIDAAEKCLPQVISSFESKCKLVYQEQEK